MALSSHRGENQYIMEWKHWNSSYLNQEKIN